MAIIERPHWASWSIGDVPLRGEGGCLVGIVLDSTGRTS
jgi:hypothetical protein